MPKSGQIDYSIVEQLESQNKIQLLESFKGSKAHHLMKCLVCYHEWTATPLSKTQTYKKYGVGGCPNCKKQRSEETYKKSREINIQKLKQRGIEVLTPGFDGRRTSYTKNNKIIKIQVRNTKCGHEFECTPVNLMSRNVECAVCGPQKRVEPLTAWSKANSKKWQETATKWQKYKAIVSALTREIYKKYKKEINPKNLPRNTAGVEGAYHLDHIVPKRFCFENNIPPEICADKTNLQMIGWRENVGSRNHLKGTIPPIFFKYLAAHDRLKYYRDELTIINYQQFCRVGDAIVDLYNDTTKHAIILLPLDKSFANSKTAITTKKHLDTIGVRNTFIFEDELQNIQLVKNKISHYENNNNKQRIHARDCIIKVCHPSEKAKFLNENHIQGNDNSQIAIGAYYNDTFVGIMTFSLPRAGIGSYNNKTTKMYELVRFATNINFRVPGIASKLLTYFKRNCDWDEIYSYADRRWSVGNLYETLGFTLDRINPPDYYYVINGTRKHRWNYRKDILKTTLPNYNSQLTEYENMQNNGYYRVWDCGTLRYSLKNI